MAPHSQDFMSADYYVVLGVDRSASTHEVQVAYRQLALKCHPDKNPRRREAAGTEFKKLRTAYLVLVCPQARSDYDNSNPAEQGVPESNPQAGSAPQSRRSSTPQPGKPRDSPEAGQPNCRMRSRTPQPDPSRDKSPAPPNMSPPGPRKKDDNASGTGRAILCGLISRAELNGQLVVPLCRTCDERVRVQVVGSGEEIAVKRENLEIIHRSRPKNYPQSGQQKCNNDGNPQSGTPPSRPCRAKSPSPPSRPVPSTFAKIGATDHGNIPGSEGSWMRDYVLCGFKSRPELNGETAILAYPQGDRFVIMLEREKPEYISVKLENLSQTNGKAYWL